MTDVFMFPVKSQSDFTKMDEATCRGSHVVDSFKAGKVSHEMVPMYARENAPGYNIYLVGTDDKKTSASVETYCANRGIEFKKLEKGYCSDDKELRTACVQPDRAKMINHTLANINMDKLEELIKDENITSNYMKREMEKANGKMSDFGTLHPAIAPTLALRTNESGQIDVTNILGDVGVINRLKSEGIKDIPMMLDEKTMDVCKSFGLLSE